LYLKILMKQSVVDVESLLKFNAVLPHNIQLCIISHYERQKTSVEHSNKLVEKAKEKALFRTQRKAVEAGAHGTLDYTIKKGVNKNKIAGEKILKSKKD